MAAQQTKVPQSVTAAKEGVLEAKEKLITAYEAYIDATMNMANNVIVDMKEACARADMALSAANACRAPVHWDGTGWTHVCDGVGCGCLWCRSGNCPSCPKDQLKAEGMLITPASTK